MRIRTHIACPAAFTLLELLVVIALLALLTALALPALGKGRETARAAVCQSHQKQLALATHGYATDYRSHFPQPGQDADLPAMGALAADEVQGRALWFNALDRYLQQQQLGYTTTSTTGPVNRNYNVFKQDPVWESFPAAGNVQRNSRTIKMNSYLGDINNDLPGNHPPRWRFFRESEIRTPSVTVLFFDGRSYDTRSVTTGRYDALGSGLFNGEEIYVGLRHAGQSANVTFVDGHGENMSQEIRQSGAGYLGWWNGVNGGPQKLNWFHCGRNGVFDN